MPYFSIVTPNFNCSKYIERSYECLRRQTDPDWEWVVVDDGSTDNSLEVLEGISRCDPRVKIFPLERNMGRGAARAEAVSRATGEVLVVWDIDDLYVETRLAEARLAFDSNIDFFCSYVLVVDNNLNIKGARHFGSGGVAGLFPSFVHPSLMFRRGLLGQVNYDADARAGEDMSLMVELEQGGYKGVYCKKYLVLYFEDREVNLKKTLSAHNNQMNFLRKYMPRWRVDGLTKMRMRVRMGIKSLLLNAMRVYPDIYLLTVKGRYMESVQFGLLGDEHVYIAKRASTMIVC